jgi:hypothetical protein
MAALSRTRGASTETFERGTALPTEIFLAFDGV